jgi:plastocyanin
MFESRDAHPLEQKEAGTVKLLALGAALALISPASVHFRPLAPDLVITAATATRTCTGSTSSIYVSLTIANQGTAPSPARSDVSSIAVVEHALPAQWTGNAGLPAITVGGSATVTLPLKGPANGAPALPLVATVNGGQWITESDYTNNSRQITTLSGLGCASAATLVGNTGVTRAALATPTPYPLRPGIPLNVMPAPTNLTYTTDPTTCINHVGFGGAFVCQAVIEKSGLLLLVWDWRPCYTPTCAKTIDGFHIYAVTSRIMPTSIRQIGPGQVAHVKTLVDTQTTPAITLRGISPFHTGECFVVTAYHGTKESSDSNVYCAGGNTLVAAPWYLRPALTHPDCADLNGFGFRDCTVAVDAYHLYLLWNWNPCAASAGCAQRVDGYNVYQTGAGRAAQQTDGTVFGADLGVVNRGTCFTVTAYHGGVESDHSVTYCATAASMATPPPAPRHVDIDVTDDTFPANTRVFIGGTVTWKNDDTDDHTVTAYDGSFGGLLAAGKSLTATFRTAGVFHYICEYHTSMIGNITVVSP